MNYHDVLQEIEHTKPNIVFVFGMAGSGKSHASKKLAGDLSANIIQLGEAFRAVAPKFDWTKFSNNIDAPEILDNIVQELIVAFYDEDRINIIDGAPRKHSQVDVVYRLPINKIALVKMEVPFELAKDRCEDKHISMYRTNKGNQSYYDHLLLDICLPEYMDVLRYELEGYSDGRLYSIN